MLLYLASVMQKYSMLYTKPPPSMNVPKYRSVDYRAYFAVYIHAAFVPGILNKIRMFPSRGLNSDAPTLLLS